MSFPQRVRRIVQQVVGQWSWTPPPWIPGVGRVVRDCARRVVARVRARPVRSALIAGLVLVAGLGVWLSVTWYRALPEPTRVGVSWSGANPLAAGETVPNPLYLRFDGVAAPLESLGQVVTKHVRMEPDWPGAWEWVDDRLLAFRPTREWPIGADFRVVLEPGLLRSGVRLATREVAFATRPFSAAIDRLEKVQVPEAPTSWRASARVSFSHPVDPASFERAVAMHLVVPEGRTEVATALPVLVTYDETRRTAFLTSDPFPLPEEDATIRVSVQPSAASLEGRRPMARPVEIASGLPGVRSVFRIEEVGLTFVENEREELERVLVIQTSLPIDAAAMAGSVRAWMLAVPAPEVAAEGDEGDEGEPEAMPSSASEVGPDHLARATPIPLTPIPASPDGDGLQGFRLDAPAGSRVFVRIDRGMAAAGGYRLARTHEELLEAPDVPRQIRIQQQGALLSLAGERTVSLVTRGVRKLRFSVGRVLPGRIQQLVTQTDVLFGEMDFRGAFGADDLVERFEEDRLVPEGDDGKPRYLSFDFSPYLARLGAATRQGVFVFRVEDVGFELDAPADEDDEDHWSDGWDSDRADALERLILVTDLGLLVKTNADGSKDAFVQSIGRGGPVAGVTVQVLGRNGLSVARAVTGSDGHVRFADLSTLTQERAPTAWWITRGSDQAFLQYASDSGRGIDLGDADVHGVSAPSPDDLAAHLFTDRGLYRPGEEVHVAYVVKAASWKPLAGVPIEVVVEDVRGLELLRRRVNLPAGGFGDLTFTLDPDAPTGGYQATVHLVHARGRHTDESLEALGWVGFTVEEFVPDRLRARAAFSATAGPGWVHPDGLKGVVVLHNLHGTVAAGHRITASVALKAATPSFREHPGFTFGAPLDRIAPKEIDLGEQESDAEGRASFDLPPDGCGSGLCDVALSARGFEASGGRGVSAGARIRVSARSFLVGLREPPGLDFLARNARIQVEVIAVDPALARVEAAGLTVSWIERRRMSVLASTWGGQYRYETIVREIPLGTDRLDIGLQGALLSLRTGESGDFLAVVRDGAGVEVARVEYAVRGGAGFPGDAGGDGNVQLEARLDRSVVAPGDTIEVRLETPFAGAGLATIERERVHAWTWFKAGKGTSVQRIQVPRDFEGNGYVVVTYLRSPDSTDVFVNPLAAVALPFTVSRDRRTVRIDLEVPENARPGTSLRVVHRADRPSRVVVYAVDEGILQVARYRLPDPLSTFLPRQELAVATRQNLDLVMPEHSRLKAALRVGGDEEGFGPDRHQNPFRRKGYRPMAFWSGIVESGPTGRPVEIPLPPTFNGTVRVMAVAVADDAVGVSSSPCVVRSPLVVLPDVPLFVAPGDRFQAAVTVEYLPEPLNGEDDVRVRLRGDDFVGGGAVQEASARLAAGRWANFPFEVQAGLQPGLARMEFTVQAGDVTAVHPVEISIRPVVPHRVTSVGGRVRDGVVSVPVARRLAAFARSQSVSASVLPLSLARGLATFLDEYPYLCTEQLVSRALAVHALREHPELGPGADRSREATERALRALRERQNDEGAFGVWAANATVSYFQNVYALQFLTDAKAEGLEVQSMLDAGLGWLRASEAADGEGLAGLRTRANAAYVLARNGEVPSDLLGDLREDLAALGSEDWEQDITAAYLAATYRLLKMEDEAKRLVKRVSFDAIGSRLSAYEDEAVQASRLLYLLARHFPERLSGRDAPPVERLVDRVIGGPVTTLSAGVCIQALAAYARVAAPDEAAPIRVEEVGPGEQVSELRLPDGLFPRAPLSPVAEAVRVEAGKTPVFYQVVQAGYDLEPPGEPVRNGLEVAAELLGAGGEPVASVRIGDTVEMRVRVRAADPQVVRDAVLVVPLPGGFEVVRDPGPGAVAVSGPAWRPDHIDVREDRILAFGTVGPEAGTFAWRMTAIGIGEFVVPPPFIEAMYRPSVHGTGISGRVRVSGRE